MSGGLLDRAEKARFSQWLAIQIQSSRGMIEAFTKTAGMAPQLVEYLERREKIKLVGYEIVLAEINSGEEMSIGPQDTGSG